MKSLRRSALGLLIACSLSLVVAAPSAAQEVPTGAQRIIEKVQFRVLVGRTQILLEAAEIQAVAERVAGKP